MNCSLGCRRDLSASPQWIDESIPDASLLLSGGASAALQKKQ